MKERLQSSDYRFLAICLVLFGSAVWFSVGNFYRAFPEASIDFRVSRSDAQTQAADFLGAQGYRLAGYRDASSFDFDDDTKTFLERELGLEKANQLMGTRVRLWRWSFRWFQPRQKEEFRADITPTGDVVGFSHELAEDAARPDISSDQARSLAEDFLRSRMHRDPATLDFVEVSSVSRPHRTDRTFTWKEHDFDIHNATNRVEITVLGNEIGGYGEFLKIPEQWTRDYERLRSKNNEAQTFDTVAMLGLIIGLIVVLVQRVRRQDVRWRRAAMVGVIAMVLSFLSSLNQFPVAEFGFPTTDSYSSFVVQKLIGDLLGALAWGGALFLIAAGAEVLYRESMPGKISLGNLFTFRGLRTKRFFLGTILGLTLCAIFIAYQTIFYIVAYKYGAWSPADVPYDELLNTKFPWLFVLFGGYQPAVFEEFTFRMFAIPYLRKLVRWLPAAVVLAAFIWGFGHAGYPQQPFFIRGLEVGIGGVALGIIMLRFGILPTLVWHYSVDAMYSAMLLLRSHSLYYKFSGAASAGIFVLPIVIALVAYWRHGGFEPETGLLNADEPVAPEIPPAPAFDAAQAGPGYRPLSARVRLAAVALFAVGLLTLLVPAHVSFGDSPNFKLTAAQARAASDAFLRSQGVYLAPYRYVTFPETHWGGDDSLAAKYFLEHGPIAQAAALFEKYRPVQIWATRYFKPLDKEEFLVTVQPETGQVLGYSHQIPEDRAGADISSDQARQLAATFAAAHNLDTSSMDLKESDSEKRKARRDYTQVWEARTGDPRNLGEAHYRVGIGVDGDAVGSMRTYWKIPEDFERDRERKNYIYIATLAVKVVVIAAAIVFGLWILIGQIRKGLVPWKRSLAWAVLPTLMTCVGLAFSAESTLYRNYDTSVPFETYLVSALAVLLMGVAFAYVMYTAALAFLLSFFPESAQALQRKQRRLTGLDTLLLLFFAVGLWLICHQFGAFLTSRFHQFAILEVDTPALIGIPIPAFSALAAAIHSIFSQGAMIALFALIILKLPQRWMIVPLVLLAVCAAVSDDVRTPGEFALQFVSTLVFFAAVVTFCLWFARDNYLVYILLFFLSALQTPVADFLRSGNPALQMQAWALIGVAALLTLWAVAPGLSARKPLTE